MTDLERRARDHHNFCASIGRLALSWAHIEASLNLWIILLIEAKEDYAKVFITPMNSASKIVDVRNVTCARFPQHQEKATKLLKELDRMREKRNSHIHASWFIDVTETSSKMRGYPQRQKKVQAGLQEIEATTEDVNSLVIEIDKLHHRLIDFYDNEVKLNSKEGLTD